ncbi:hypothetical protein [Undibacterium pigrum]|nr:hypothetical protein [Undibacterium pigrum]
MTRADVDINIRLLPSKALEVSYQVPLTCNAVTFKKNGSDVAKMRSTWLALDDCGKADGQQLSRQQAACTHWRFQVPASTDGIWGYPAAFPVGDAMYVHTSNFAVDDSCGKSSYSFSAPGIAMHAQVLAEHAQPAVEKAANMSVLLMPKVFRADGDFIGYFDPALGEANISNIRRVAGDSIAFLRRAMPKATFEMPVIAAARVSGPGGPRPDGDASDVLRLGLFNWPAQPDAGTQRMMTLFVSHEFSHRFQMRDAVDAYANARLMHEGGAEFMRWLMALQKGWLTKEQAAEDLDMALSECLLGVRNASWGKLSARQIRNGRLEYHCGLAAYVYGLAARKGKASPFERLDGFYEQLRLAKTQSPPDFAYALECGQEQACQAIWLPRLLGKDESMQAVWADLFAQTGFANAIAASLQQKNAMINMLMQGVMTEDCGSSSTYPQTDKLGIGEVKGCKLLRDGMNIIKAENLPLYNHPDTLAAAVAACKLRSQVRLSMESGLEMDLPCKQVYQPVGQFYAVDMTKLLAGLNR